MREATVAGRIGRKLMPGEGTVQMLRERPEVLEFMAMTEFAAERGILGIDMERAWRDLPEETRLSLIDRAFLECANSGAAYDASLPPEPTPPTHGGAGVPTPDGWLRSA